MTGGRWARLSAAALWAMAAGLLAAQDATAQDHITTSGRLSDHDFYRLVACAAPPGGPCAKPFVRWQTDRPLRVGFARIDDAYLGGKQARARAALTRAVQYINDADAGITLAETDATDPDIQIYLLDTDGTRPISNSGIDTLDGQRLSGARVMVWANASAQQIVEAKIIFATRLSIRDYESAMIEEVTQALGLLTDIKNPLYDGISVLSQDSNAAKQLGPQDISALRRHYSDGTFDQ